MFRAPQQHFPKQHFVAMTLVFFVLAAAAGPAFAKKNDPNIDLDFRPQQAVAAASVDPSDDMFDTRFALRFVDKRPGDDSAKIGTRTDDDDKQHTLKAVNKVGPYVERVIEDLVEQWDLTIRDGGDLVLTIALRQFKITETNQAVGATYNAEVHLSGTLEQGGKELWSDRVSGDATRYGKKFSNANVNEVLSDALLEATAALLSDGGLHREWPESGQ